MSNLDAVFILPRKSQYSLPSPPPDKNVLYFKGERDLSDIVFIPLILKETGRSDLYREGQRE